MIAVLCSRSLASLLHGPADANLALWAEGLSRQVTGQPADRDLTYAIEGTSSYGAGLVAALRPSGVTIHEVARPNRRDRRLHGKKDAFDAENAARAVLAGTATGTAKPRMVTSR